MPATDLKMLASHVDIGRTINILSVIVSKDLASYFQNVLMTFPFLLNFCIFSFTRFVDCALANIL